MNILIFDTETTDLEKPFMYDIGAIIYNTDTNEVLEKHSFIIQQVWHNLPLFHSAYYANKRDKYIGLLRSRQTELIKCGFAFTRLGGMIRRNDVKAVFAYNSKFDDRVMKFNSEWFKVINPIEHLPVYDIRAIVHEKLAWDIKYQGFCEKYGLFTDTGNYSTTAESVYKFVTDSPDFVEEHMGLQDAEIELAILKYCVDMRPTGWNNLPEKTYNSIPRICERTLTVVYKQEVYEFDYTKRMNREKGSKIILT